MAVEESGLMAFVREYYPLLAILVGGAAWVGRGYKLVGRIDALEAAQADEEISRMKSADRLAALERLVGDIRLSVATIEASVHGLKELPALISDLRADLAGLKGEIKGSRSKQP